MNDIQISRLIFPNPHSTPTSVLRSCLPLKIMFFDRLKSFSTISPHYPSSSHCPVIREISGRMRDDFPVCQKAP